MSTKTGSWIAFVLMAGSGLSWFAYTKLAFARLDREIADYPRVKVPGSGSVRLEARKHIVWLEGPGSDGNRHPVKIVMRHRSSERRVSAKPYEKSVSYEAAKLSALVTVEPPLAGVYDVVTAGHDDLRGYDLAFGGSTGPKADRIVIVGFAIACIPMLAGALVLTVNDARREGKPISWIRER